MFFHFLLQIQHFHWIKWILESRNPLESLRNMFGSQKSDGWITLGLKQQLKLSFYVVLGKWTLMQIACKIYDFEIPAVSDQFCGRLKIFEVIVLKKISPKGTKSRCIIFRKS
ncbi:MAG: hypothetical protein Ct9H90mP8_1880 [Pseudomonadota bacterium]|nr:MAG: hypothetical protein Ct9H90mP8_1880 [Pseudomonadota bacterium]